MTSLEIRRELVKALQLDLIGPDDELGYRGEILPQAPSRWYLTGYIVPIDADQEELADADSTEEVDEASDAAGIDDAVPPEPASARQRYLPSSIGLSILASERTRELNALIQWGD